MRFRVFAVAAMAMLLGVVPARSPAGLADPSPADTGSVAPACWPGFPLLPDGRFPIAAWCAPPPGQTNDERYAEYAGAGLNVTMGMLEDPYLPGPSLLRLEVSRRHRIYAIVRDNRVHPDEARRPGWRADVDATVRAYAREPALLGYFLADEPEPDLFPSLAVLSRRFAQRDSRHPAYVNFVGFAGPGHTHQGLCYTEFLRRFVREARPAFFSIDHYSLLVGSDSPYFIATLDSTALVSRETGVPFWAILQLTPHLQFRALSTAELAWQANLALAHGARGIVWFTYWTPNPAESFRYRGGPISYDGRRNPSYAQLAELNPRIQALGRELSRLRPLGVRHVGSVPYGCTPFVDSQRLRIHSTTPLAVGLFGGAADSRTYLLLVNRDYRRPTEVRLTTQIRRTFPGTPWAMTPTSYGIWDGRKGFVRSASRGAVIRLGPGDAQLVRLVSNVL